MGNVVKQGVLHTPPMDSISLQDYLQSYLFKKTTWQCRDNLDVVSKIQPSHILSSEQRSNAH